MSSFPAEVLQDEFIKVAIEAARAGGEICRRYFSQDLVLKDKDTANLVTEADIHSERKIVELIRSHFPDHAILAEEDCQADIGEDHLWIVDPLDGTNNFAHQIPHFAVSIGYWRNGIPTAGVIFNPVREEMYVALRGQGAFDANGQLNVSRESALDQAMIGCGFYYDRGEMMRCTLRAVEACFKRNIHGIRRFGTASLDLIQVASGRYGGYFEYRLAPWDFAAGRLFVEEAGGRVTTCCGTEMTLGESTILASNGKLHEPLLEIVQEHLPDQASPGP